MAEYNITKTRNWQTAGQRLVTKYVADLKQTGTDAPVATELFNSTDIAFTYEYVSTGVYTVTSSKPIFTGPGAQKVQVNLTNSSYIDDVAGPTGWSILAVPFFFNVIFIISSDLSVAADGIVGNNAQNALEVTIYP